MLKNLFRISALVVLALALGSCALFEPKPSLGSVGISAVIADGESLTISWNAVDNAEDYILYFTDDGSEPDTGSPQIVVNSTTYSHTGLNASKNYRYMVSARASDYRASFSSVTSGSYPSPIISMTVTFASYPNDDVAVLTLDVPYNSGTDMVDGSSTNIATYSGTTDGSGSITFELTIPRNTYFGFTVAKDVDASGTINTGDTVWGSGGAGTYTYSYWKSYFTASTSYTVDWDNTASGASHIY